MSESGKPATHGDTQKNRIKRISLLDTCRDVAKGGGVGQVGHASPPERKNKIFFIVKKGPGPKNSGPNPRSFRFLVGDTLGQRQVDPLLDEILATFLYTCNGFNSF